MSPSQIAAPLEDPRALARVAFVQAATGISDPDIQAASADASARSYWRTRTRTGTAIVMDAPPSAGDLGAWLGIAARLRAAGLHVPEVLAEDREGGFLLLADLGSRQYLQALGDANVDALYGDALAAHATMLAQVDTQGLPRFDEGFVVRELELMPNWFLQRHLGVNIACEEWDILEVTFRVLVENAIAQPQGFMHRDFHSRNLMYLPVRNPGIVDFQDAVLGPATYDAVSLLRDCYIAWGDARVRAWAEAHRLRLIAAGVLDRRIDAARWRRWFDLTGLQRHLKVLGIFCRLWYRDGKRGYLADLPLTWEYVRTVACAYPELRDFLALLEHWVGHRDLTREAPR